MRPHNVSHQDCRERGRGRAARVSVHVSQAEMLQSHSHCCMLAASLILLRQGLCKCMTALPPPGCLQLTAQHSLNKVSCLPAGHWAWQEPRGQAAGCRGSQPGPRTTPGASPAQKCSFPGWQTERWSGTATRHSPAAAAAQVSCRRWTAEAAAAAAERRAGVVRGRDGHRWRRAVCSGAQPIRQEWLPERQPPAQLPAL